jgi:hypothetical protein
MKNNISILTNTLNIQHKTHNKNTRKISKKIKKQSKKQSKKLNMQTNNKRKESLDVIVSKIITDDEIKKMEGQYFPVSHYKQIIDTDADIYYIEGGKKQLLCSFRKNVIPKKLCDVGFESLYRYASRWHTNRGAAAGIIDENKMPPHVDRLTMKEKFRAYYYSTKDGKFKRDHISNLAQSNIIGFYDIPDRNIKGGPPCRETKFNKDYPDKWNAVQPLLQKVAKLFKKLVPNKYSVQYKVASQTPDYQIKKTPFSTATINYNWQTALHKDKGDFMEGFGNLIVLERGKYEGGYLGFPQYGVCFNVRNTDFLAMDVHQWHCNTDLVLKTKNAARVSVVCYLRKNMLRCKN